LVAVRVVGVAALAVSLGLMIVSCSSSKAPSNAASALPARVDCFSSVKGYRFDGRFALNLGAGNTRSQIGALSNLLQDVRFDGAYKAPNASSLDVHFAQGDSSQDLQTIKLGDRTFQRTGQGGWQDTPGSGPILTTINQIDPRSLCNQTLAKVDLSSLTPARETLSGVAALHYTLGPDQLARTPGLFGEGDRGNRATAQAGESGALASPSSGEAPDATLDVWLAEKGSYPLRIALKSSFGESGGSSTLDVSMNLSDFNGADIVIKAPS
jgi:hypothetical protein